MAASLPDIERHFGTHEFYREFCVLPGSEEGRYVAVVVPDLERFRFRKLCLPLWRIGVELEMPAVRFPEKVRFEDVVIVDGPLPRAGAEFDRQAVTALLEKQRAEKAAAVAAAHAITSPAAERFLKRLAEIMPVRVSPNPAHELERDLGMDSLDQVHLLSLLELEFGVAIADDEQWTVRTVGDCLARIEAAGNKVLPAIDQDWARRVREPSKKPLEALYELDGGLIDTMLLRFGHSIIKVYGKLVHNLEVVGGEKIPQTGPVLICPTHLSLIDGVLLLGLSSFQRNRNQVTIGFGEYFHTGPLGFTARRQKTVLTGEGDSTVDSLRLSYQALQRGMAVGVFPEGDRSWTGDVLKARNGVGVLALEAQVPMIPVIFQGSNQLISHERPGWRPCPIRVVIGDPILPPPYRKFTKSDYDNHMELWRSTIRQMEKDWGGRSYVPRKNVPILTAKSNPA